MTTLNKPIAALASGASPGAIAILRMSGSGCHSLLKDLIKHKSQQETVAAKMRLCDFIDPKSGTIIDEPMVAYFSAPNSYTGEESAEIFIHGGSYLIQKSLNVLFENGFSPAEPGEFTQRAFLNGKMDLTAAEGIKELIDASSEQQWMAARQLATGKLANYIEDLREKLMNAMAWLEARIDFPDEKETSAVEMQQVIDRVDFVSKALKKLANTYESGRVATQGLSVALIGKPNVGKSTLLNSLLGKERAIVTDIAGTTRDYIEESCLVKGRLIRLIDTAGIRDASEKVEKIGVEQSINIAKESDIVLFLASSNSSKKELKEINDLIGELGSLSYLKVMTKSDLSDQGNDFENFINISCTKDQGISELIDVLADKVDEYIKPIEDQPFVTSTRHKFALDQAREAIEKFEVAVKEGQFEEMLAFELQQAAKALISIIGEVDSDDVLGVIFGSFCVGK